MAQVRANGIDIEYESIGPSDAEPLLLVMGLGAQLISWPRGFCELLAAEGFRVIRYDNRDVGLSSKFDDVDVDVPAAFAAALSGQRVEAPYLLTDMAEDGFGVLDVLGIDSAHVVGVSMGGMIAQTMAIIRPERVRTLTSIMSTTGSPEVGQPAPEAMTALLERPPAERAGAIEHGVKVSRVLSGPGFPFDEDWIRQRAAESFDRCYNPDGTARQLLAIMASGDRTEDLGKLTVPTLVIHGDADPLVTYSGGEATAKAVPGAQLLTIEGMGHSLPEGAWSRIVQAVTKHARAAVGEAGR